MGRSVVFPSFFPKRSSSMLPDLLRRLEAHRDLVLDVLRIYLGAGLFVRGIALLGTHNGVRHLAGSVAPDASLAGIATYVIAAHVVGGAFLLVGLYTRLAALSQLPVLLGAVFLVHWQDGLLSANQSLEFSSLVLFLLVVVCLFGGGRWSLDARWGRGPAAVPEGSKQAST